MHEFCQCPLFVYQLNWKIYYAYKFSLHEFSWSIVSSAAAAYAHGACSATHGLGLQCVASFPGLPRSSVCVQYNTRNYNAEQNGEHGVRTACVSQIAQSTHARRLLLSLLHRLLPSFAYNKLRKSLGRRLL